MIDADKIYVGDIIMMEVLQGIKRDDYFLKTQRLFKEFAILNMCNTHLAIKAAEHYRILRSKGVTIRKSMDVLIGTACIEYDIPLLYSDRDFDPMVKHLKLKSAL